MRARARAAPRKASSSFPPPAAAPPGDPAGDECCARRARRGEGSDAPGGLAAGPRDAASRARRTPDAFGRPAADRRVRRGRQRRPRGARVGLRRRSDGQARRVAGGRNVRSKTRWLAGSLQFAPRIACRRVLHRRRSQEIRCRGLCWRPLPPRSGGLGGARGTQGLRRFCKRRGRAALRPRAVRKENKKSLLGAAAPLPFIKIPPLVY